MPARLKGPLCPSGWRGMSEIFADSVKNEREGSGLGEVEEGDAVRASGGPEADE